MLCVARITHDYLTAKSSENLGRKYLAARGSIMWPERSKFAKRDSGRKR